MNSLYFGDNLDILRAHLGDATVDLIYLDPPFNSHASYNVLFKTPKGHDLALGRAGPARVRGAPPPAEHRRRHPDDGPAVLPGG